LPLIALIYADQESCISSISVDQRDQRLNSSGFVFKYQGKEKEFLPLIALIYADPEVSFLPSASICEISG
jgi:hypothetical protein